MQPHPLYSHWLVLLLVGILFTSHFLSVSLGCNQIFHSSGQLYSHKRKHEKSESEPDASPSDSQSQSYEPPPAPVTETYPTGTTLTSIDGLPVFKRKRGRPPKNQVLEVPQQQSHNNDNHKTNSPFGLPLGLSPFSLAAALNGAGLSTNYCNNSTPTTDGLIPVPMLPILQLFNLQTSPNPGSYSVQTSPDTVETLSNEEGSADGDNSKRQKLNHTPRTSSKDDAIPDGYLR